MARFEITGMDEIIDQMKSMQMLTGEVAESMLMAGAEEVRSAWRESAEEHGHRDTGQMIASVGYARKPKAASDALSVDIYPQGTRPGGVRNAEVAFVLHHGSGKLQASHWVDDADAAAGPRAEGAMVHVWDVFIQTGQTPPVQIPNWTTERRAARAEAESRRSPRFRD